MPEPRRIAIVLIDLSALTEALGLMKHGEISRIGTDRYREGGRIFLVGDWTRGGKPPDAALVREPGEVARAVSLPPGLIVVEAFTDAALAWMDGLPHGVLKAEGAALPPIMPGQPIPRYVIKVEEVPQPAGLPSERRGRLVLA